MADQWVYKVRDAAGELIYVGVTGTGHRRLHAHARRSRWAPLAASIEIEHFADRAGALARETQLIRDARPEFNLHGNPDAYPLAPGELSAETAAAIARCSAPTIMRAIRRGQLPAHLGRRGDCIIDEADLRAWIESPESQRAAMARPSR